MSNGVNAANLENAIARGLDFLQKNQLPSGEFKIYLSEDKAMEGECVLRHSVFPAAVIAYSLSFSASSEAAAIIQKITKFFLDEMAAGGVWRYFSKEHSNRFGLPPDVDDTVCVADVLRRNGIPFPPNHKLLLSNRNRRGLFYTWITPRMALPPLSLAYWKVAGGRSFIAHHPYYFWNKGRSGRGIQWAPDDIDSVVNANVLFYLGECAETQPVIKYLIELAHNREEASQDRWYLNSFNFYYAVSRNFYAGMEAFGAIRNEIIERIESATKSDGAIGQNALDTALAVCALFSWRSQSPILESAIAFLLNQQSDEGQWPRAAFYHSTRPPNPAWGSEEMTTGFCLEALLRYHQQAANS